MSKLFNKTFLLIFTLLIFILTACIINKLHKNRLPEKKPSDFDFVLNYGINAENQLDTQNGTYTKDMIKDPSVTTTLKLTDEEMNEIYVLMKDINLLNYPDNFSPKSNIYRTPFKTYSIKIIANSKEKNIYLKDENVSNTIEAVKLRNLFKKIHEIISVKEEYKKLPEPVGGYL